MSAPDVLVAGVPKAGTSALATFLGRHPDVHVVAQKEAHHHLFRDRPVPFVGPGDDTFARMVVRDREAYAAMAAPPGEDMVVVEASVYYLQHPDGVAPVLADAPDLRVVVVLRDPVARAHSAWAHMVRDGREDEGDLLRAVDLGPGRVAAGWEWIWDYEAGSRYVEAVDRLRAVVGDDRVLLVRHDELEADPGAALAGVFAFLGVSASAVAVGDRVNPSGRPRSRRLHAVLTRPHPAKDLVRPLVPDRLLQRTYQVAMARNVEPLALRPEERAVLVPRFEDDVRALEERTGWDLAAWRTP